MPKAIEALTEHDAVDMPVLPANQGSGRGKGGHVLHLDRRLDGRGGILGTYRSYELVATALDGGDVCRLGQCIAERTPEAANVHLQILLVDEHVRPRKFDQILLADLTARRITSR